MKRSIKKSVLILITLLAICTNALGFSSVQAAPLQAPPSEAVAKSGVAGAAPIGGNGSQTIDWTINYDLTSDTPLTNMTLTDTWSAGQTLVPGSVQTPGGTWNYSQPNSTSITFTNPLVAPNGQGAGISLSIPLSGPISFSGGGDGFNPVITDSGKILGINHHISNAGIWCYDMVAGASCPGYKVFPGINTPQASVVRAIGNRIYIVGSDIAGSMAGSGTIYCWDTDTNSLCGTSPHLAGYDRLEVVNDQLYVLLSNGQVDCFDPANALARCAGYPITVGVAALGTAGNDLFAAGNSLYVLNSNAQLNCLDTSTLGFCSGFSSTPIAGPSGMDNLFPRLNAAGEITGICQVGTATAATCYDLNGANPTTVAGVAAVVNGMYSYYNDDTYFGSRVWFGGLINNVGCWDWSTNAACTGAGFTNGKVTTDLGYPYGITHDTGCLYAFGDFGSLYSIDPNTGQTPCTASSGEVTVNIDDFYNAAPGSISANWNKISLTDINLTNGVEFTSLVVTVFDPSNGSIVTGPTEMIDTAGDIDISAVSTSIRELKLQVVATPVGTTAWADSISPKIWLTFASNTPIQFTYQTTITCSGASLTATNTINTTLDPHSDQATVSNLCINNHTVTFDKNAADASGTMPQQSSSSAANLTTNAFTRSGYSFSGWNTVANGSGTTYANGATYDFAADITLYAQWAVLTATFSDVPLNGFGWAEIEAIYAAGITGGCSTSPFNFCPNNPVTRAQLAVFLLRSIHGASYTPPAATGTVFTDVPSNAFAASWIEQLVAEGITSGCGGGNYCPNNTVTRSQIAVFLLRAKYGSAYTPPAATGTVFTDVPSNAFAAAWVEELVSEGITSGCGGGKYCPNSSVTRAQMAVLLQRTFNFPLP